MCSEAVGLRVMADQWATMLGFVSTERQERGHAQIARSPLLISRTFGDGSGTAGFSHVFYVALPVTMIARIFLKCPEHPPAV